MILVSLRPGKLRIEGHSEDRIVCACVSTVCMMLRRRATTFEVRKAPIPSVTVVPIPRDPHDRSELIVEALAMLAGLAHDFPDQVTFA